VHVTVYICVGLQAKLLSNTRICVCVRVCSYACMCVCARDGIHLFAAIVQNVVKHTQFVSVLVRVHVRVRVCVHVSLYILDRGYR